MRNSTLQGERNFEIASCSDILTKLNDRTIYNGSEGQKGQRGNPVPVFSKFVPGHQSLSTPRKIVIAALFALGFLLVAAFFLVYFGENDSQAVELTARVPEVGGGQGSGVSTVPAEGNALPEVVLPDATPELRVYVAGAVHRPGVYPLAPGNRLVDGVEAAGGATDDADLEAVNLAMRVEDEGYYYIPAKAVQPAINSERETMDSTSPTPQFPAAATNRPATQSPAEASPSETDGAEPAGPVNLNTATQSELETLPSIGPARARAIIAYREENGPFSAVEEITAVSGIGQGILDNLQGLIAVGDSLHLSAPP